MALNENETAIDNEAGLLQAELPPVEKVTDLELALMYAKLGNVNEALQATNDAGVMTKVEKATLLMAEFRDLVSMQCSLIHNLKAELNRLRQFGFGAE